MNESRLKYLSTISTTEFCSSCIWLIVKPFRDSLNLSVSSCNSGSQVAFFATVLSSIGSVGIIVPMRPLDVKVARVSFAFSSYSSVTCRIPCPFTGIFSSGL